MFDYFFVLILLSVNYLPFLQKVEKIVRNGKFGCRGGKSLQRFHVCVVENRRTDPRLIEPEKKKN